MKLAVSILLLVMFVETKEKGIEHRGIEWK